MPQRGSQLPPLRCVILSVESTGGISSEATQCHCASSDHFLRRSFLCSIVGCNGCRVYSSTPTSRTVFFGSASTDCAPGSCFPMVRLAEPVTGWWSCTSGTSGFPSYPQKALPWHG